MEHANGHDSNSASPPAQKRQRAKQACEPCRLRKRRCDGNVPCNMCTQFEYKCYFEKHPRKRSKIVEHDAVVNGTLTGVKPEPPREDRPSLEDMSKVRSMEANSGIAFTRLLGMRLDPSSGPKLFTFGWNLGNSTKIVPHSRPITEFLAHDQMNFLASLYFANVHPLYGFLDKDLILNHISVRFSNPEASKCPDHLLMGLAAVAMLFSDGSLNHVLHGLVESAKLALESTSIMQPSSLPDVQSWILRTLYLRATDHPHACWMASSLTMHLVESTGLHQEASSSIMYPQAHDSNRDPEIRRRTFWIARMLNSWVSFEYGRTRVALRGIQCHLPTAREEDYTVDYVNLYSLSCCLDPDRADGPSAWEDFLKQLETYDARHDGIELSKANLGLCAYRRLRLANPNLPGETTNRIIRCGLRGLEAARRMADQNKPWWHVANVPFQCICVFLAMDARESLSHVATAMRTLEYVVERFHTVAMKEALKTARFLVRLSKKKKDEDSDVLAQSLKRDGADADPQPENMQQVTPQPTRGVDVPLEEAPLTTSSGEDWNLDYLNNTQFDWNYFLSQDIPAFQDLAPDGTM